MKELQSLRDYILNLKNTGLIDKKTEIEILHKLNSINKILVGVNSDKNKQDETR